MWRVSIPLKRELKISPECCWHMIHRIHWAMREAGGIQFSNIVQMDEHYAGGPFRPEHE
jgi:hypothetical protein